MYILDEVKGKEHIYIFASTEEIVELEETLNTNIQKNYIDSISTRMGVAKIRKKKKLKRVLDSDYYFYYMELIKQIHDQKSFFYKIWFEHK